MNSRAVSTLFIFLLLMFWLEYRLFLVPNSYSWKNQKLAEQCSEVKCLVVGSSHSYYGINPDCFSLKTFNIANASQSLILDTAIIKHYINQLPKLQAIIIPISVFSMEYCLLDSPEDWRDCYSLHFLGVAEASWWQRITNPKYFSLISLYGPIKVKEILSHHFHISYAQDISPTGWYCGNDKHIITQQTAKARIQVNEHSMKSKNIPKNLACLNEVLSLCAHHNIKVVFVSLPVHQYYFQNMDTARWQNAQAIIRSLCEQSHSTYLDYLQDKTFTQTDFCDPDHLSIIGASRLSQMLNKQIIRLTLR